MKHLEKNKIAAATTTTPTELDVCRFCRCWARTNDVAYAVLKSGALGQTYKLCQSRVIRAITRPTSVIETP